MPRCVVVFASLEMRGELISAPCFSIALHTCCSIKLNSGVQGGISRLRVQGVEQLI